MSDIAVPPKPDGSTLSAVSQHSVLSVGSLLSTTSAGSVLSVGSAGSILSVGSVASVLSVASAGSVLSIASAGSVLSIGSVGSVLSIGGRRRGDAGRRRTDPTPPPKDGRVVRLVTLAVLGLSAALFLQRSAGHGRTRH